MKLTCACGASYRVPEKHVGKKVRCKRCSTVLVVAAPAPNYTDGLEVLAAGAAIERPATPPEVESQPHADEPVHEEHRRKPVRVIGAGTAGGVSKGSEAARPVGGIRAYLADVARSFYLPLQVGNLVTIGIVSLALLSPLLMVFGGCFGVLLAPVIWLLAWAYFAAFMLTVVQDAAAGNEELTQPDLLDGFFSGVFRPAFLYLSGWVVSQAPTISLVTIRSLSGAWDLRSMHVDFSNPYWVLNAGLPRGDVVLYLVLYLLGQFLFPMILLVFAVGGGVYGVVRVDLIARTILRTLPGYCIVTVCVYASQFISLTALLAKMALPSPPSRAQLIGLALLSMGLYVYASMVTMRAVGLYYHHFKKRFAWSWG